MAWTPANLFGAADTGGWFDASDLGTLFQDSAGTIPVTGDTQPVGLIKAKAGAGSIGFHLTQATSAAKPTYRTSAGQSWLQFDGGDWLDSGLSRFGRAGLHATSSENWTVVVAIRTHAGGTYVGRAGSTSAAKTFQLYTANGLHGWVLRGTVTANITNAAGVFGARWDGATAKIRFGNAEQAGTVGTAVEESTQRILVGGRSNGAGSLLSAGGSIAQVFFIDRALTATELDHLYWYFAQSIGKTGIGTAPPSSEVALDATTTTAPAAIALGGVITSPTLEVLSVLAPATPTAAALVSQPTLGVVSTCAPAGVGTLGLGSTQALGSVTAGVPAVVGATGLLSAPALGEATASEPAVLDLVALGTSTALGSAEAVSLATVTPAPLALFAPEPVRSACLTSRDAAPRLHTRARAGLTSRSVAPVITSRAA